MEDTQIKDSLLKGAYVAKEELEKAEKYAKANRMTLAEALIAQNLITKDLLGQGIAEGFRIPYADLNSYPPTKEQALKIPEEIAKKYRVVLFKEEEGGVTITTDNPASPAALNDLKILFPGKKIVITYSLPEDIEAAFNI